MKTITINAFDENSINNAIAELKAYKKSLTSKCLKLIEVMCAEGEDYAINAVGHVDTGETLSSIMGYRKGKEGIIVAGGQAIWIEFGTGVGRAEWAGGVLPEGIVAHGEYGKGYGKKPPWFYYDEADGKLHIAWGLDATSFMWKTARFLENNVGEYARKVFNEVQ